MSDKEPKQATLHEQLTDENKSTFSRYQDLALGSSSIWYLIKYELIMLFVSWVPGALGLVLRKVFYPFILGSVGRGGRFWPRRSYSARAQNTFGRQRDH